MSLIAGSQEEAAETLGINTRTLQRWLRRGCPGEPRAYVIRDIVEWAKKNAWIPEQPAPVEGQDDYGELLEAEKYREKKRENDIAEKLYAPIEVIEEVIDRGVTNVIAILESLPLNMKRHFPELTGDQITLVKTAVAECRNAMADTEVTLDD